LSGYNFALSETSRLDHATAAIRREMLLGMTGRFAPQAVVQTVSQNQPGHGRLRQFWLAQEIASPKSCSPHIALSNALGGEPTKSVPIEAYAVTRAHRRDCHALLQDQRMLDVSIEPKSVRLQVRAIRAGREQVHRDIMRTVAGHRKIY
jgi:hypothetical protein